MPAKLGYVLLEDISTFIYKQYLRIEVHILQPQEQFDVQLFSDCLASSSDLFLTVWKQKETANLLGPKSGSVVNHMCLSHDIILHYYLFPSCISLGRQWKVKFRGQGESDSQHDVFYTIMYYSIIFTPERKRLRTKYVVKAFSMQYSASFLD